MDDSRLRGDIPASVVSVMLKAERIDATLTEYIRNTDRRMEWMERRLDGAGRRSMGIDWSTVIKLLATLAFAGMAAAGILTWPEAAKHSAALHGG